MCSSESTIEVLRNQVEYLRKCLDDALYEAAELRKEHVDSFGRGRASCDGMLHHQSNHITQLLASLKEVREMEQIHLVRANKLERKLDYANAKLRKCQAKSP